MVSDIRLVKRCVVSELIATGGCIQPNPGDFVLPFDADPDVVLTVFFKQALIVLRKPLQGSGIDLSVSLHEPHTRTIVCLWVAQVANQLPGSKARQPAGHALYASAYDQVEDVTQRLNHFGLTPLAQSLHRLDSLIAQGPEGGDQHDLAQAGHATRHWNQQHRKGFTHQVREQRYGGFAVSEAGIAGQPREVGLNRPGQSDGQGVHQ